MVDKYFPDNKQLKQIVVLLITKKIGDLIKKKIELEIEEKNFHIELKNVKSFSTHI